MTVGFLLVFFRSGFSLSTLSRFTVVILTEGAWDISNFLVVCGLLIFRSGCLDSKSLELGGSGFFTFFGSIPMILLGFIDFEDLCLVFSLSCFIMCFSLFVFTGDTSMEEPKENDFLLTVDLGFICWLTTGIWKITENTKHQPIGRHSTIGEWLSLSITNFACSF